MYSLSIPSVSGYNSYKGDFPLSHVSLKRVSSQGPLGVGKHVSRQVSGWGTAHLGGGGDLVLTIPRCVCSKVKDMGSFSGLKGVK